MSLRLFLMVLPTVLLAAVFVGFAGQAIARRKADRPLIEYLGMAFFCAWLGWQAVGWLRADHPAASVIRFAGVWVQLVSGFGIAGVMIVYAFRRLSAKRSSTA